MWLDGEVEDGDALQELLHPCADKEMSAHAVSPVVNKAGNEGAECVAPV